MRGQKNRQNCQSSRFKVLAKSKLSDENTLRWKSEEKARLAKDKIFRKKIRSLGEKLADLQKIHGPVNTWKHAELEILRLSFSKMVNFIEELKKRVSDLS